MLAVEYAKIPDKLLTPLNSKNDTPRSMLPRGLSLIT